MSFHHAIVAFDGSERSADALALAVRLIDPDALLTLACVVPGQRWQVAPHVHRADAPVPDDFAAIFEDARRAVPRGIRVHERAPVAASPARGLTELAEDEAADVIVIGSSGHGDVGRISLERTAGRLLQGAPCAVAIAPAGLRETSGFRHVGVAYDDSPEARVALAAAYGIAAGGGAAVTLFAALPEVEPEPMAARQHAEAALDAAADSAPPGISPRTALLRGSAGVVIADACDGVVDLLVTGSRGYGPVHRAMAGSVSELLTEGASHPVLIVPRPASRAAEQTPAHEAIAASRTVGA